MACWILLPPLHPPICRTQISQYVGTCTLSLYSIQSSKQLLIHHLSLQLWGNPKHMASVAKSLRAQHPRDKLYILLAKRNSGSFTYDGIERGGERVCLEIEEELQVIESKGGKIKKLSIVGYSLGGLVARYAVGLLYARGVLDTVECMVRSDCKHGNRSERIPVLTNLLLARTSLLSQAHFLESAVLCADGRITCGMSWVPAHSACPAGNSLELTTSGALENRSSPLWPTPVRSLCPDSPNSSAARCTPTS